MFLQDSPTYFAEQSMPYWLLKSGANKCGTSYIRLLLVGFLLIQIIPWLSNSLYWWIMRIERNLGLEDFGGKGRELLAAGHCDM